MPLVRQGRRYEARACMGDGRPGRRLLPNVCEFLPGGNNGYERAEAKSRGVLWGDESMNVQNIVFDWLASRGYDGLFNADIQCACRLEDLMPCDEPGIDCTAGYLVPCPGTASEVCDGDCEFHIVAEKPAEERRK